MNGLTPVASRSSHSLTAATADVAIRPLAALALGPTKKLKLRPKSRNHPIMFGEMQFEEVPCFYQTKPSQSWQPPFRNFVDRTHTNSITSRQNWAAKEFGILTANHAHVKPTHEGVIKFNGILSVSAYREFHAKLRRRMAYHVKSRQVELACYWVRELEINNRIHLHLLVRSSLTDPSIVLAEKVQDSSDGTGSLAHCEPIKSVEAISRYTVKHLNEVISGEREVLLFRRRVGLNICGQFGGYFVKRKTELWEECRKGWFKDQFCPTDASMDIDDFQTAIDAVLDV